MSNLSRRARLHRRLHRLDAELVAIEDWLVSSKPMTAEADLGRNRMRALSIDRCRLAARLAALDAAAPPGASPHQEPGLPATPADGNRGSTLVR